MFGLLRLAIALVGTLAAGAWDLKTTDVPDKLVFLMIAAGLALGAAEGVMTGDWSVLVWSLGAALAFSAFSLVMYYAGAWGAGDGALLVAVGSLLPYWPFANAMDFVPFPLAYFVSVFAVGLVYSSAYLAVTTLRDRKASAAFRREFSKISVTYVPVAVLLLLFVPMLPALFSFVFALVLLAAPPLYALSNASDEFFYRRIPSSRLRPGDMIGEDLPRLNVYKRRIRGLTSEEISAIRRLKRSVRVRSGVRYGIVFFLALLSLLLSVSL